MRISDWSSDVCSSDLYLATLKPIHDGILFRPLHPSMDKADGIAEPELQRFGASLGSGEINLFAFLDQRTYPIGLPAPRHMAAKRFGNFGQAFSGHDAGFDRLTARRHLVQPRTVQLPIISTEEHTSEIPS